MKTITSPLEFIKTLPLNEVLTSDIVQTVIINEFGPISYEVELWLDIKSYRDTHPCNPDRMITCYELIKVDQAHLISVYDNEEGEEVAYTNREKAAIEKWIETENNFDLKD